MVWSGSTLFVILSASFGCINLRQTDCSNFRIITACWRFDFFNFKVFSERMKKIKTIFSPPLFVKLILPSCLFIQCNALIIQQQRFRYVSLKKKLIYINAVELNILVDFLAHSFRFPNSLRKSCSKSTPNVFCCDRTSKKLIITQTQTMFWKTEILSQKKKKMSQCQAKFEKKKLFWGINLHENVSSDFLI